MSWRILGLSIQEILGGTRNPRGISNNTIASRGLWDMDHSKPLQSCELTMIYHTVYNVVLYLHEGMPMKTIQLLYYLGQAMIKQILSLGR